MHEAPFSHIHVYYIAGEDDDDNEDIQFDGSGFITAMQEMFEFKDNESVSSSDMSEYGWEEEDSDDEGKTKSQGKQSKIKRPPSLDRHMDVMDKELAKTEVGKSFERQSKIQSKKTSEKETGNKHKPTKARGIDEEDDDFQPVDIDLNTVRNFLESYGAQGGDLLALPPTSWAVWASYCLLTWTIFPQKPIKIACSAITPTRSNNVVVTANDPKPKAAPDMQSTEMYASKQTPPLRLVVPPRRNTPSTPKSPGIKPRARPPPPSKDSKETDVKGIVRNGCLHVTMVVLFIAHQCNSPKPLSTFKNYFKGRLLRRPSVNVITLFLVQ